MKLPFKWEGKIVINEQEYNPNLEIEGPVEITLIPKESPKVELKKSNEIQITVKSYMTKEATPEFDFMAKFNNNIPMPLMTMVGTIEKETRGMVYMKLHGDLTQERTPVCMKCGKPITNLVSQFFGLGPVCGNHNYTSPFESEDELKSAIASYKQKLKNITWEGWIIKSAILEREDV